MKKAIELLEDAYKDVFHSGIVLGAEIKYRHNAMDKIKAALVEMKSISRFETPEQREQCTGEPYPEEAAVRVLYDGKWELMEYWRAKQLEQDLVRLDKDFGDEFRRLPIVCDSGAVVPDRNWRPEEEE